MTTLKKAVRRVSNSTLSASHGRDKNKRIVITLIPGNGGDVPDMIRLKPERLKDSSSRSIVVEDLWSYMIRCEVNQKKMATIREKKAKKEEKLKQRRWKAELRKEV